MSDLRKDNFEEFLRNSLEDYSSNDSPNWEEMESRLDAQAGAGSGSGIFANPLTKWIAAMVVVGGLTVVVANLLNSKISKNPEQENTDQDSFMSKIRALSVDNTNSGTEKSGDTNDEVPSESATISKVGNEGNNPQKLGTEGDESSKSEDENIVFTKAVPPVTYQKSGPQLTMLRSAYSNQAVPEPIAEFSSELKEGCVPLSVNFAPVSHDVAVSYLWNFGDDNYSTAADPVHVFTETGTYNVALTVTSLINQKYITEVTEEPVIVYGRPDVDFKIGDDYNEAGNEISFINYSSNIVEWSWDFGDGSTSRAENPNHTYAEGDSYDVILIGKDANGCKDTMMSTIRISGITLTNNFFAPSAFTPNGDGSNDEFKAIINGPQSLEFEMSIYDRQGNLIFETDDINQPWDGRLKGSGRTAPQGTYIWLIILKDDKGEHDRQIGEVTLLK